MKKNFKYKKEHLNVFQKYISNFIILNEMNILNLNWI